MNFQFGSMLSEIYTSHMVYEVNVHDFNVLILILAGTFFSYQQLFVCLFFVFSFFFFF